MNEDLFLEQILSLVGELVQSGEQLPDSFLDSLIDIVSADIQRIEGKVKGIQVPRGADLLWILSGGEPDAFVSYLKTIPDPELNQLLNHPQALQEIIGKLQTQVTLPAGQVAQGVPKADLNSSNVYGYQYNPRSKMLRVRFNSGSVYEYDGVPPQIFKVFQAGAVPARTDGQNKWGKWWKGKIPSLGAAFYHLIRSRDYPYKKVA